LKAKKERARTFLALSFFYSRRRRLAPQPQLKRPGFGPQAETLSPVPLDPPQQKLVTARLALASPHCGQGTLFSLSDGLWIFSNEWEHLEH
jgi:hypothetical protein